MRIEDTLGIMTPLVEPGDPKAGCEDADVSFPAIMDQLKLESPATPTECQNEAASTDRPTVTGEADPLPASDLQQEAVAAWAHTINSNFDQVSDPGVEEVADFQSEEPSLAETMNPDGSPGRVDIPGLLSNEHVQGATSEALSAGNPKKSPASREAVDQCATSMPCFSASVDASPPPCDEQKETGDSAIASRVLHEEQDHRTGVAARTKRVVSGAHPAVKNRAGSASRSLGHEIATQERFNTGKAGTKGSVLLSPVGFAFSPEQVVFPDDFLPKVAAGQLILSEQPVPADAAKFFTGPDRTGCLFGTEAVFTAATPPTASQQSPDGSWSATLAAGRTTYDSGQGTTGTVAPIPAGGFAQASDGNTTLADILQGGAARPSSPDEYLVEGDAALFFRVLDGAANPGVAEPGNPPAAMGPGTEGGTEGEGPASGIAGQGMRKPGVDTTEAVAPPVTYGSASLSGTNPILAGVHQKVAAAPVLPHRRWLHADSGPQSRVSDSMNGRADVADLMESPKVPDSSPRLAPVQGQTAPGVPRTEGSGQSGRQAPAAETAGQLKSGGSLPQMHPAQATDAVSREGQNAEQGSNAIRTLADAHGNDRSFATLLARTTTDSPGAQSVQNSSRAPEFLLEVAERISTVVKGAGQEVTIRLKPDHLGRISLVAQNVADGLVAHITTESTGVRQFLENNLPVLQQALEDQGLKVRQIDVVLQARSDPQSLGNTWQQRSGDAETGQADAGQRGFPTDPAVAAPVVEEIRLDPSILAAIHPHSTFHTIA